MDIGHIVSEHGTWSYLITFGWTFIEGETFLLLVAAFAANGALNPIMLLICAWLGSFSGDQCYFWIGRRFGLRLLARRPRWRQRVDRALDWVKRYDTGFILSFRFIYGVRNFSSFALGMGGIGWCRFLVLNFLAAGIWAVVYVG
ncbi:MAG TPA: DedA family protein, partial [Stellaceae bacterium]|nr:DedA family protein [Stellaceae bacterium]